MNATTTEQNRIAGALACMEAMRKVAQLADNVAPGMTCAESFRDEDTAIAAVLTAAEPLNAFMSGFVEAMAHYIYECNGTGMPDLEVWRPNASITNAELLHERAEIERSFAEG